MAVGSHPSGRCENICANERRRFMANFNICCGDVNPIVLFWSFGLQVQRQMDAAARRQ